MPAKQAFVRLGKWSIEGSCGFRAFAQTARWTEAR